LIAEGRPQEVLNATVLKETYRGEMVVFHHDGMVMIGERPRAAHLNDNAFKSFQPFKKFQNVRTRLIGFEHFERFELMSLLVPFEYEFFRNGFIAAVIIGALCGFIGVYVVLAG